MHGIARALREGASRIVVLRVDRGMEGNFSRSYVRGLDEELAEHDHVLLVRHGHEAPEATQKILDAIAPRAVLRLGEVYMRGHEPIEEDWENGFAANAALQIGYLAEWGHTLIAMAMPDHDFPLTETHLGFSHAAARRLGLPPLERFVVPRPRGRRGRRQGVPRGAPRGDRRRRLRRRHRAAYSDGSARPRAARA